MKIDVQNVAQENVLRLLCELSARETVILNLRYCGRKTQKEVAEILGITDERVRQLEDRALETISKYFN